MTADELVDVDFEVSVAATLGDEEIIAKARGDADIFDDEDQDDGPRQYCTLYSLYCVISWPNVRIKLWISWVISMREIIFRLARF